MIDFRRISLGFALGMIPGLLGIPAALLLIARGTFNAHHIITSIVSSSLDFAFVGGALGAIIMSFVASIRKRMNATSLWRSTATGFAIGTAPGLNGICYMLIFLQCGYQEPQSFLQLECLDLNTFYLRVFTYAIVVGGALGALTGGSITFSQRRRSRN